MGADGEENVIYLQTGFVRKDCGRAGWRCLAEFQLLNGRRGFDIDAIFGEFAFEACKEGISAMLDGGQMAFQIVGASAVVGEIGFDRGSAVAKRHDGQDGPQFRRFELQRIHVFLQGDGIVLRHHGKEINIVKGFEFESNLESFIRIPPKSIFASAIS